MSLLRVLLLAAAVVCFASVNVAADAVPLNVTLANGASLSAYSTFRGAENVFLVSGVSGLLPSLLVEPGQAVLSVSCKAGVTVSPSSICLSDPRAQLPFSFKIATSAPNTVAGRVCTWTIVGSQKDLFTTANLNAALDASWTVLSALTLNHEAQLSTNPAAPLRVAPGEYTYTFSRPGSAVFEGVGTIRNVPVCTNFASSEQAGFITPGDRKGNWTVTFGSEYGNVRCQFSVVGSDAADNGRYVALPPVYFRIMAPIAIQLAAFTVPPPNNVFYQNAIGAHGVAQVNISIALNEPRNTEVRSGGVTVNVECLETVVLVGGTTLTTPVSTFPASYVYLPAGQVYLGQQFSVAPHSTNPLADPAADITIVCSYTLDESGDYLRFAAPTTPTTLRFVPRIAVLVTGNVVGAITNGQRAVVTTTPGQRSITVEPTVLPLSGELLTINVTCDRDQSTQVMTWTSASTGAGVRAKTYSFTLAAPETGTGQTFTCTFLTVNDEAKYADTLPVVFQIGTRAQWTLEPAQPLVTYADDSQDFTLTPSSCLPTGTLEATCDDALEGSIRFASSGTNFLMLDQTTTSVGFSFEAASYITERKVITCSFELHFVGTDFNFVAPDPISFEVAPQAGWVVGGLRDLALRVYDPAQPTVMAEEDVTFTVAPAEVPGFTGVTARVSLRIQTPTSGTYSVESFNAYWFEGSMEAQSFTVTVPTDSVGNWWIRVRPQSTPQTDTASDAESQSDVAHFVPEFLSTKSLIGRPVSFSLSATDGEFVQRSCAAPGERIVMVTPDQPIQSTVRLDITCTNGTGGVFGPGVGNGIRVVPDELYFYPTPTDMCVIIPPQPLNFTVYAQGYDGNIVCSFTSNQPLGYAPPAALQLYSGITDDRVVADESDDGLSGGAIAGIVIAVLVVAALIAAFVYFFIVKRASAPAPQKVSNFPAAQNEAPVQPQHVEVQQAHAAAHPVELQDMSPNAQLAAVDESVPAHQQ